MDKRKTRFSLRSKITLVIGLLVFSFGGLVIFIVGRLVSDAMISHKTETVDAILAAQTHETIKRLDMAKVSSEMAAGIPDVIKYLELPSPKPQDEVLLAKLKEFSLGRDLASLYVINNKGVALVSTDPTFVGSDFSFRKYVQKALAGEAYNEMAIGSVSKKLGFYFSTPIKNAEGKIIGVMAAKLDPKNAFADLENSKLKEYGNVMLVNSDGVVIFSLKKEFLYKSLAPLSDASMKEVVTEKRYPGETVTGLDYPRLMDLVQKGESSSKMISIWDEIDQERELVGAKRIDGYSYYLMSESDQSDVLAMISQISLIVAGVILVALISVVSAQSWYLGRVMKPLGLLDAYAAKVSGGNLDESIEIKTGDELQSLAENIHGMVMSIKNLYSGLEKQVEEKTVDLSATLLSMESKNADLENSKKAITNLMEDLNAEKEKIAADKNKIETILKSIGDGVFVTDIHGNVVMVNQAAERMAGLGSVEMYGKRYSEIFKFADEDKIGESYPDFVMEAMEKGRVGSLLAHTILVSKDGTYIPVLDSAAPLRTPDGVVFGCVVVFRDNTVEREEERNKDNFLSVASHQLRTPLGSMRWNAEMLLEGDAGELNEETKEIIGQIHEGNLRMIDLVNDLLDVSRIDQGRIMNEPEETDLASVIDATIAEIQPLTMEKRIKLGTNIDRQVPRVVLDKKRFREIVENLLSNAVKYNKSDGEVTVNLNTDGQNANFVVSDTGMGIPKNDLANLFSKFFRAENAIHSETEGTGLGLYVVKMFVESWGGKIAVQSEEGKGSTFTVSIPLNIQKEIKA